MHSAGRAFAWFLLFVPCVFVVSSTTGQVAESSAKQRETEDASWQACPFVELHLIPSGKVGADVASFLRQQSWTTKVEVETGDVIRARAWIAIRKRVNLMPLLGELRALGYTAREIRLREFGDIRIQFEFAQSVELGKTGKGRSTIKAAIENVVWVKTGLFYGYHTRLQFRGGQGRAMFALKARGEDIVRLDELIGALRKAGFPPKNLTVSRLFPGIPFGKPLPSDLELTDSTGKRRTLAAFKKPKRPLAVAFVSLKTKTRSYGKYKAEPSHFERLGKTVESYRDRVDFVVISSNMHDAFADVVEFWGKTGLSIPLLHDANGMSRAVFNAQITPPPHLFVFDADGLLRYAGDAHSHWQKPGAKYDDYLAKALDLTLADKHLNNGAVFQASKLCNCSHPGCKCGKCGCGSSCRCGIKHCGVAR